MCSKCMFLLKTSYMTTSNDDKVMQNVLHNMLETGEIYNQPIKYTLQRHLTHLIHKQGAQRVLQH